ncbi:hypothetical protein [Caballeronia sordidicola]|uniref:hypothetical protein n=1 Tax=Caballeronia sordidicola TaxID=196367 RepID=UPI0004CFEB35|nr:hypothetical protein [Caballeronia sordidicola]
MQVIDTQVSPRSAAFRANADAMSRLVEDLRAKATEVEHTISTLGKGNVKAFRFAPGGQVADGAELADFEGVE